MVNAVRSRVFRYGMIYMVLFLASVFVIFLSLYFLVSDQAADLVDAGIRHDVEHFVQLYADDDEAQMIADLRFFLKSHPGYAGIYLLQDGSGRILAGNLDRWPDEDLVPGRIQAFSHQDNPGGEEPAIPMRGTVGVLPGDHLLLVGRNYSGVQDLLQSLHVEALYGLLMALVLGFVVSMIMSRSLSARLERINRTTLEILDTGLDIRMPLNGSGDEFDRLAVNLNRMLDQIQRLMVSLEGVTDNIAHDLRSPLNRLKSRLEVALLSERSAAEYQTILSENVDDIDGILSTFNSLLTIARVRSGVARDKFQRVDLAQVVRDTGELYEPVAEDKGQTLQVHVPDHLPVQGNPDLLAQALANLVDNAIKYSPTGAEVSLTAERQSSRILVQVRDTGPGIPEHFRTKAFERFARLDTSRSTPGQGLGLSLVEVVAELHEGHVTLEDGGPGLLVRLDLPAAQT